jgi:hypothetical protein
MVVGDGVVLELAFMEMNDRAAMPFKKQGETRRVSLADAEH